MPQLPADPVELGDELEGVVHDLRTVAAGYTEEMEYEIYYIDPEIGKKYADRDRDEIMRDTVLESIAEKRKESLFELGSLNYTSRIFDDGINVLIWGKDSAILVGLGPQTKDIQRVIEVCERISSYRDENE